MPDPPANTIAYLTSVYARASDSFIRGEVHELRALGFTVHTFSIRRPDAEQSVSDEIHTEQAATDYLLSHPASLVSATILTLVTRPASLVRALGLALKCSTPGIKGRLWSLAYLAEAAYLARRMRTLGVEHLHNHIGEGSATVAMLAAQLAEISFSNTMHGPNEFDRPTLIALREKIKRAAFTVAISQYGQSQLFRWSDFADWSKIQVVHCGVSDRFLQPGPSPLPRAAELVSIGRLAEQKGSLLLLLAAAELAREGYDFHITFVGDGPLRRDMELLIQQHQLDAHVTIAGWLGADEVKQTILAAKALVLPSLAEGLPVVIMEALALGRPVISTYVAGIPELVQPGHCGWLVPAGAVQPLAAALRELLATPDEVLQRMGTAGAERVAKRHHAPTEAAKLARLIALSVAGEPARLADPAQHDSAGGLTTAVESAT